MSSLYILFLLISLLFTITTSQSIESLKTLLSNTTDFDEVAYSVLGNGSMATCCLTYKEYLDTLNSLKEEYPHLIKTEEIGKTYQNNSIISIQFQPKFHANKAILFTGMHHGREPTSMMMNMYILLKLIQMETTNETEVSELLDSVNIYFIPVINVDAYILNNERYDRFRDVNKAMTRKNRRDQPVNTFDYCKANENFDSVTIGVDLNRNYGYKFGYDNEGSSGTPCKDDYRGVSPFSEPETLAVKNFIENHPEIKVAFNYHAYGNLLIVPFNYADSVESSMNLFMNYTLHRNIYEEFRTDGHFPDGFKEGNGKEVISYKANGEASDWMLGEKHILSFSPELGINDQNSNYFYPSKDTLFTVLKQNINSALYAISRAAYFLQFHNLKKRFIDCEVVNTFKHKFLEQDEEEKKEELLCKKNYYQYSAQIQLHNNGFSDFKGLIEFQLKIKTNYLKFVNIKLNTGHVSVDMRNVTNNSSVKDLNQTEKVILGNPNSNVIFEKSYEEFNTNSDENINFIIDFVESFNGKILEIKFYVDKNDLANIVKQQDNFLEVKRIFPNANDTLTYLKSFGLKFNYPEYSIKLSDFEKFEVNLNPADTSKIYGRDWWKKEIYNSFKYLVWLAVFTLLGMLIVVFFKLRATTSEDTTSTVQREQVNTGTVRSVENEGTNSRNLRNDTPTNIDSYIELNNMSREFYY